MSDSDDDVPLAQRQKAPAPAAPASRAVNGVKKRAPPAPKRGVKRPASDDDEGDEPSEEELEESSESEADDSADDVPLASRSKRQTPAKKETPKRNAAKPKPKLRKPAKRPRTDRESSRKPDDGEVKWKKLSHAGVLFPPEYETHGVKMLYDGKPVDLTPEQEEVATMFAVMKETDYMNKPQFLKNFWDGFKEVLGKKHVIQCLEKCDFTPMFEYLMAEREKKKEISKEEKLRAKEERDVKEAKYKFALIDGRREPVGNFRVEPPGLFRGRGEHPKMGMIKKRVFPRDIVINIGEGEPIPEHPYPGQTWKEVRHDHTVTWLAYWKDTVSQKDYKYVFLGATSTFKADSDFAKYEKARALKELIGDIRKNYERDWDSADTRTRQMAVALYFIDKLALRAGHEKDDDEADTVGCCTLKVENVELIPPNHVKFDFLGKDSIRYENTVDVHAKVYKNLKQFVRVDCKGTTKKPGDQLFETFDANDLNKELKSLMDGLSVKVFRTYNASITLDKLLAEMEETSRATLVDEKKVEYDRANKEVAILCNHQRSVPKAHTTQLEKMQEKLAVANSELADLEEELRLAKKGKSKDPAAKKPPTPESVEARIAKKMQQIQKMELQMQSKEDLKTVALGTSKINYMDPRITIAWCKRNEVPIEKIFNKSLLAKFNWAMDVAPEFRF